MNRSSLVDRVVVALVLLIGAALGLRMVYDLLKPLVWVFALVSVVTLVVLVWRLWRRFWGSEWR
jgi:hypothetical protein